MKKAVFVFVLLCFQMLFGQEKEVLKIEWPEEYKMKKALDIEDEKTRFVVFVPENETVDNWTILGSLVSYKKTKAPNVDIIIKIYEEATLKESPLAKLMILEKSKEGEGIWVLFKVETPSFPNDPKPESQLWYVIQGEKTLHSMFIAKKEKTLSKEFIKKWSKVFKSGEFFYEYSDKTQ